MTGPPGSAGPCVLNVADPTVDLDGNLSLFNEPIVDGDTNYYFAWTGPVASIFDADTTQHSIAMVSSSPEADDAIVSDDTPTNATPYGGGFTTREGPLVRYGTTVTYTLQLVDVDGDPVAQAGVEYLVDRCDFFGMDWAALPFPNCGDFTVTTNSSGTATWTADRVDPIPPPGGLGDKQYTRFQVDAVANPGNTGPDAHNADNGLSLDSGDWDGMAIHWRDQSIGHTVVLDGPDYIVIDASAATAEGPMVATATVYDDFGMPAKNVNVKFTSGEGDGLGAGGFNLTNASGVATSTYLWNGAGTAAETITAEEQATSASDTHTVYWVWAAEDGDLVDSGALVRDVPNKSVVAANAGPVYRLWTWEAGDQFNVWDGGTCAAVTQAEFETAVGASADNFEVTTYFDGTVGTSVFKYDC